MPRRTRKLRVIPQADPTRVAVLVQGSDAPLFVSEGNTDFVCGSCGHILARAVEDNQMRGFVVQCFRCNHHNTLAGLQGH